MSDQWQVDPSRVIEMPPTDPVGDAYRYIFEELVPEAIEFFKAKSRDYQSGGSFLKLGSRAQFVQMDRKHVKLEQGVWEGRRLEGEQPEEIVMDQIGHCFLMLCCLRLETKQRAEKESWEHRNCAHEDDYCAVLDRGSNSVPILRGE